MGCSEFEKNSIVLKLRTARKRMKAELGRCEGRKPYGDRGGGIRSDCFNEESQAQTP
jgi:hypothetical protein